MVEYVGRVGGLVDVEDEARGKTGTERAGSCVRVMVTARAEHGRQQPGVRR